MTPAEAVRAGVLDIDEVLQAAMEAALDTGNPGFCCACGEETDGVEPDARAYVCESCGQPAVYGAEEVAMAARAFLQWLAR